ncbi:WcbI family polysaccharide biosynthesis putative acetyltransferase [Desulfolutivibrio sulfoxidireducens]|uniref:WcbI family polysaccharide biosynthesis putative acetyltransferase n=1 Tax=Desulfolutivibrio sulfoxidireducens TaxID=2773299 RepID=UPI00159E14ED|nr:WcbI family polysaccharide biosynthesis putative acetyltransferase [Desulfolutivibrio sulfoxidireducens]QLA17835.1 hypothetical protein GD605_17985 [Desulfolutivibrio sulfoxidireducens]QLA21415.1 hypothetical protein GD604_17615 [Desulfolutivibrio sulfoxidireducens]
MGNGDIMTAPGKKKIVLSQTCQGLVLERLLMASKELQEHFSCTFIPNYETLDGKTSVASSDDLATALGDCDILIYHDVSSYDFPSLIRKMPPGAQTIKIPYITSNIYWPTLDFKNPCWLSPHGSTAHIPWPCVALNELIVAERDKKRVIDAYLALDLAQVVSLDAVRENQIGYLRAAEKDSIFHLADYVEQNFIERQLFHLINHPAMPVFLEVANTIFQFLGIRRLQKYAYDPFHNHQIPLHPSIIRHYNITWCDETTKFTILDKSMCFEEYVNFYVDSYIEKYQYTMFPVPQKPFRGKFTPWRKLKDALAGRMKSPRAGAGLFS